MIIVNDAVFLSLKSLVPFLVSFSAVVLHFLFDWFSLT